MLSLLFVLLIPSPSSVFLCCILDVPSSRIRTLEAGVGTLASVNVTVVDARTIPWSGRTTPGSLSVCHLWPRHYFSSSVKVEISY